MRFLIFNVTLNQFRAPHALMQQTKKRNKYLMAERTHIHRRPEWLFHDSVGACTVPEMSSHNSGREKRRGWRESSGAICRSQSQSCQLLLPVLLRAAQECPPPLTLQTGAMVTGVFYLNVTKTAYFRQKWQTEAKLKTSELLLLIRDSLPTTNATI